MNTHNIKYRFFIAILFIAMILGVSPAIAQNQAGGIEVAQKVFALEGDSITVQMDISYSETLKRQASVMIIPVLKSNSMALELPVVVICGNTAYKSFNRMKTLGRTPYGAEIALNTAKTAPGVYPYKATVRYEDWMKDAELTLREEQCNCNGPAVPLLLGPVAKLENRNVVPVPEQYEPRLAFNYITPEVEEIKKRSEYVSAYLNFSTGKWDIVTNFKNNSAELDKIYNLVESLRSNTDATVTGIIIEGYASPDGTSANNQRLSERRAESLKNHIKTLYRYNESFFTVKGMGEDWITLDSLVSQSDINHKYEVLNIIRSSDPYDTRDKNLLSLAGGAVYRQMLNELYPQLRRVDYKMDYTVIPFTIEKGKEVFKTKPSLLSLNEMFLISQTYTSGSKEFNELFETAAVIFPQSDVANLNATINAFTRKDIRAASAYMDKVATQNAVYYNNMGVLSYLKGNMEEAADYFAKARTAGSTEAAGNIVEMEKVIVNRKAIEEATTYNESMKARMSGR